MPSRDLLFGGENCIVQQDNDPKHTANIVKEYWTSNGIELLDWPSQLPDLNPIDNLWAILDNRLKGRRPNSEEELYGILHDGWQVLDTELLTSLVDSMPRRLEAVIAVNGKLTKY